MRWKRTRKQREAIAAKMRGIKRSAETNARHSHVQACSPREVLTAKPVVNVRRQK